MYIYSDIFCPVHSSDYHNVIARKNMQISLSKVCCKYATLVLLAAWKTQLLFIFWMDNRLYLKLTHFSLSQSLVLLWLMNVNTEQLISYLHHLYYTLFIIIRGFVSWASRTLGWTRTLVFWTVSGFWLKTPQIGYCVIEINRNISDLLQCTTLQKQSVNTNAHLILTWGGCQLLSFCCLCLLSCSFPESWTWLHICVFLKSSWRPIF